MTDDDFTHMPDGWAESAEADRERALAAREAHEAEELRKLTEIAEREYRSNLLGLCSTADFIPGYEITRSLGIVTGQAIMGANVFKDIAAAFTDAFGGRSQAYEKELKKGKDHALWLRRRLNFELEQLLQCPWTVRQSAKEC